jgi:large subunit ribosomal protein L15
MTPGFEGGQMPLKRRLPKRGFTNLFRKRYVLVNLKDLGRLAPKAVLDVEALKDAGLLKGWKDEVKLLGVGEISVPINVQVHRISRNAKAKIEAAGGKVEIIGPSKRS